MRAFIGINSLYNAQSKTEISDTESDIAKSKVIRNL